MLSDRVGFAPLYASTTAPVKKRSASFKRIHAPQNFIVKHTKNHRHQIERDNMEVKALFSYLSQLYRAGFTEDISNDHHPSPTVCTAANPKEISSQLYQDGHLNYDFHPLMFLDGEHHSGNQSSGAAILRNFSSSCSFSTPFIISRLSREISFTFVDNLIDPRSGGAEHAGTEDRNGLLSTDAFLSSLTQSGFLPLQILLGSIPGVDISDQNFPLISPFVAAMTYLESIGMGFSGIRFSNAFSQSLESAHDAATREVGEENAKFSGSNTDIEKLISDVSNTVKSWSVRSQRSGVGEEASDDHIRSKNDDKGKTERLQNEHDKAKSVPGSGIKDTNFFDAVDADNSDNISDNLPNPIPWVNGAQSLPCVDDDADERADNTETLNKCTQETAAKPVSLANYFTSLFGSSRSSDVAKIEDVVAFLQPRMPPTHAIDAAIDYIKLQTSQPLDTIMPPSALPAIALPGNPSEADTAPDSHKKVQEGYTGSFLATRDSHPSPTSVMEIVIPLRGSNLSTCSSSSFSSSPTGAYYEGGGGFPKAPPAGTRGVGSSSSDTHAPIERVTRSGSSSSGASCNISAISSMSNISSLYSCDRGTMIRRDSDIDKNLFSRIPPFYLSSLVWSPADLAEVEEEPPVELEWDADGGGRLVSVENAFRFLGEAATSTLGRLDEAGNEQDSDEGLCPSFRAEERALATSAMRSLSETLHLSTRILDLRHYPLFPPSLPSDEAPVDDVHIPELCTDPATVMSFATSNGTGTGSGTGTATPLEHSMLNFAEMLRERISSSSGSRFSVSREEGSCGPTSESAAKSTAPAVAAAVAAAIGGLSASPSFTLPDDFLHMSDTSGAVALLALMTDCVCSSEFDCFFDDLTSSSVRKREREREREEGILETNKKRRAVNEESNPDQLISKRQQRCPKCGEFKKGHICKFIREADPPSPKSEE